MAKIVHKLKAFLRPEILSVLIFIIVILSVELTELGYRTTSKFRIGLVCFMVPFSLLFFIDQFYQDGKRIISSWLRPLMLFLLCLLSWVLALSPGLFAFSGLAAAGLTFFLIRYPRTRWRVPITAIYFLLAMTMLWLKNYEVTFGLPTIDSFIGVFQTDFDEGARYASQVLNIKTALELLILSMITFLFSKKQPATSTPTSKQWLLIFAFFALCTIPSYKNAARIVSAFTESITLFKAEVSMQQKMAHELPLNSSKHYNAIKNPIRLIVVILESVSKHHMQIYDYHRDTTPFLSSIKDQLYIHTDTVSPHSHTVESLQQVLSAASTMDGIPFEKVANKNIITVLRQSDVKTRWYSNQNEYGLWDNPVALMGKQAEKYYFIRKSFGMTTRAGTYDRNLIDLFQKDDAAQTIPSLHIFHFYSAHWPYCELLLPEDRYKKIPGTLGAKFFGEATDFSEDMECYDRTIAYIDQSLAQLYAKLKEQTEPTALLVLSDHGEAVELGTSHNSSQHSSYHVEVPHFWWFNTAAQSLLKNKIQILSQHLHTPFDSDYIYDSVLDLMGAQPNLYEAKNSLFSSQYSPKPRVVIHQKDLSAVHYDQIATNPAHDRSDYRERTRIQLNELKKTHPDAWNKIWAHRTDTLGKLLEAKRYFSGIELDVMFIHETGTFHVYHPPVKDNGLEFEEVLQASKDVPDLKIWMDWKNASSATFHASMKELLRLDQLYKIKKRVLVETGSTDIFPELQELKKSGFKHSYYLPTEIIIECKNNCAQEHKKILAAVKTVGATGVSYDFGGLAYVNRYTSDFKGLEQYTWDLNLSSPNVTFPQKVLESLSDKQVLLVEFPSIFYW